MSRYSGYDTLQPDMRNNCIFAHRGGKRHIRRYKTEVRGGRPRQALIVELLKERISDAEMVMQRNVATALYPHGRVNA